MGELFVDIFEWIVDLPPLWAYATILAIAYGENIVPPVPGDMVIVLGGYLASVGQLSLFVVFLLATLGGALGFMSMYAIGYRLGDQIMDPGRARWLPKERIRKAQKWIRRYGYAMVAGNRFLSGLRSVISLTVGMARMNVRRTTAWATFGAALWTGLIAILGYLMGENWEVVSEYLRRYGMLIATLIVVLIVVQVSRYLWNLRKDADTRGPAGFTDH